MNTYRTYSFAALPNQLLHDILHLRCSVFIVEQNAPYADIDGLDPQALHVCMLQGEALVGYVRILGPGVKFEQATMGRIVLHPATRGAGLGRQLITHALSEIRNHFSNPPILIEAREDLQPVYRTMGFETVSEPYDWAGITYVKMLAT